jgi:serine/threonine protein kinase
VNVCLPTIVSSVGLTFCSDIKPENIFLDSDCNVLLGDFGLSVPFDPTGRSLKARAGTLHYAAPEAFLETNVRGPELDIWSAGVVLYVMLRGRYPFWRDDEHRTIRAILMSDPHWPEWFPTDAIDLLTKMLTKNPRHRISIAKLKRHPFVRDYIKSLTRTPAPRTTLVAESPLSGTMVSPTVDHVLPNTLATTAASTTTTTTTTTAAPTLPALPAPPIVNIRENLIRLHNQFRSTLNLHAELAAQSN